MLGEHGLGKSTAARFLIKKLADGVMFCNCHNENNECCCKGVAQATGISVDVHEKDVTWKTLAAKAVAAAKPPDDAKPPPLPWSNHLLDRLLHMCGGGAGMALGDDDDQVAPTIEKFDVSSLKSGKRALIAFDDFNNVTDDNILFVKHLFPIVGPRSVGLCIGALSPLIERMG